MRLQAMTEKRLADESVFDWDDAAFIVVSFCMICKYHSSGFGFVIYVYIYIYIFTHLIVCKIDKLVLFL